MKVQDWIVSVRYAPPGARLSGDRRAVVGPARASTVEAALHLAGVPEHVRAQVRGCGVVRDFVEGSLDPDQSGYYTHGPASEEPSESWFVCIGSVHEVLR